MAAPTYIEIRECVFVNAAQVICIGVDGFGAAATVLVAVPGLHTMFHKDQISGPAAQSVSLELLKALGQESAEPGKMRVITYLDGAVQTRYL